MSTHRPIYNTHQIQLLETSMLMIKGQLKSSHLHASRWLSSINLQKVLQIL